MTGIIRREEYASDRSQPKNHTTEWRLFPPPLVDNDPRAVNQDWVYQRGDDVFHRAERACDTGRRGVFVRYQTADDRNIDGRKRKRTSPNNARSFTLCVVRFLNKKEEVVRCKRIMPLFAARKESLGGKADEKRSDTVIVTVSDTADFRRMAASQLLFVGDKVGPPNSLYSKVDSSDEAKESMTGKMRLDRVLEIGCSTGETSVILWRTAGCWLGVDTSADMVQATKQRLFQCSYFPRPINEDHMGHLGQSQGPSEVISATASPSVPRVGSVSADCMKAADCLQIDALKDAANAVCATRRVLGGKNPSVVFVDIGGSREIEGVIRMLHWVRQSFVEDPPRLIVVKSKQLFLSIKAKLSCGKPRYDGVLEEGEEWFREKLAEAQKRCLPKHPFQAPKVLSPLDGKTPICRYHNCELSRCAPLFSSTSTRKLP